MRNFISHIIFKSIITIHLIRRIEWQNMMRWLDAKESQKILDIACGVGTLSLKIAEKGCRVYGVDLSQKAISRAKYLSQREKIACEFSVQDAEKLSFQDGYFDKVICSSALEHFSNDIRALKEMNRVLSQVGTVVLTVDSFSYPINNSLKEMHTNIANVVNYYTYQQMKDKLKISGFNIVRSKYIFKSPLSGFFYDLGIRLKWGGLLWKTISLIAYPLCLLSDRFWGRKDGGYTLIVEATKY